MRRREFLAHARRSALASALLPLHGRLAAAPRTQRGNTSPSTSLARLAAALENQIPGWTQQAHVPGLSIVVASVTGKCGYVAMTNGDNGADVLRNVLTMDAMQQFLTAV